MRVSDRASVKMAAILADGMEQGGVFRITAHAVAGVLGQTVDFEMGQSRPEDAPVPGGPLVADVQTATILAGSLVDFDEASDEFVITVASWDPQT